LQNEAQAALIQSKLDALLVSLRVGPRVLNAPPHTLTVQESQILQAWRKFQNCGLAAQSFVSAASQIGSDAGMNEPILNRTHGWISHQTDHEPIPDIGVGQSETESRECEDAEFNSRILQNQLHLARQWMKRTEYESAENILSQLSAHLAETFPDESPWKPDEITWKEETMQLLAISYFKQAKWNQAQELLIKLVDRRAHQKSEALFDNEHMLAHVYFSLGDPENAEKHCYSAVVGKRNPLGEQSLSFYRSVELLVSIYKRKGEIAKAEGYKVELPDDYYHQERQDIEKLIDMKSELAVDVMGRQYLVDLIPAKEDWRWTEIRENILLGGNSICGSGHGYTLLHAFAEYGCPSGMRVLLEQRPKMDVQDNDQNTPLHLAVNRFGPHRESIIRLLLDNGAKIDARALHGITPLMMAAMRDQPEVVRLCLENGAEIEYKDDYFRTALHHASIAGSEAVVELLLELNAEINALTDADWTPLHCAASWGKSGVVSLLLQNRKLEVTAKSLKMAISLAKNNHHNDIVRLLTKIPTPRRKWSGNSQKSG
jgi:hypothetical protein